MEKLEPCAPCWCGSGKAYKDCHCAFDEKYESLRHPGVHLPPRRLIKNEAQIEKIRRSAKVNIAVLDYVAEHIRPGVSTEASFPSGQKKISLRQILLSFR